jgi:hypothetical protein
MAGYIKSLLKNPNAYRWRPQDIIGSGYQGALVGGWKGLKNFGRGLRGDAAAWNVKTGEKEVMNFGQRINQDLRKRRAEFRSGVEVQFDKEAGRLVPKMEKGEDGIRRIVRKNRATSAAGFAADAVIGGTAAALGWGTKTAAGAAAYGAIKSVRPLGHAAYQSAGIVRDAGLSTLGTLHGLSKTKAGSWGLFAAPMGIAVGAAALDSSEHSAVNRGLMGFEGEQLDSAWGNLTGSNFDVAAAGESQLRKDSLDHYDGKVMDTFGSGGDLVFAMHRQR